MKAPPDASPFTPQWVHDLLRNKVLNKRTSVLPAVDAPEVAHLARTLTTLRQLAQSWAGPFPEEQKQIDRIRDAIQTLTELLPELRKDTAASLPMLRHWGTPATVWGLPYLDKRLAAQDVEVDVSLYDDLIIAAWAVRDRGLPLAPMSVLGKRIMHWKDFAKELREAFESLLPEASNNEAYSFIWEVAPFITGDKPALPTVESTFKQNRF